MKELPVSLIFVVCLLAVQTTRAVGTFDLATVEGSGDGGKGDRFGDISAPRSDAVEEAQGGLFKTIEGWSRTKGGKMEEVLMPLLLAYKLKFTVLVPLMLGGFILLVSTTAVAGFFFALFAAVLSLTSEKRRG